MDSNIQNCASTSGSTHSRATSSKENVQASDSDIDLTNNKEELIIFLTDISVPIVGKEGSDKFVAFMLRSLQDEKDVYRGCVSLHTNSNDDLVSVCHGFKDCPSLKKFESVKEEVASVASVVAEEEDHSSSTSADNKKESTRPRRSCSTNTSNNSKSNTRKKSKNGKPVDYTKVTNPCLCDGNPYCLASLGGVVTCVLYEHSMNRSMGLGMEKRTYPTSEIVDLSLEHKEDVSVKNVNDENKEDSAVKVSVVEVEDDSDGDLSLVATIQQKQIEAEKVAEMEIEDKGCTTSDTETEDEEEIVQKRRVSRNSQKEIANEAISTHGQENTPVDDKSAENEALVKPLVNKISRISTFNMDIPLVAISLPDDSLALVSRLRQKHYVPNTKIMQHLKLHFPTKTSQETALETIQSFHSSFFLHPQMSSKKLTLSLPPGIENLGATCYLNSFFQCLAHNPAFLQSIASWKQISMKNIMLEKLQQLLLSIRYGPNHCFSAKEFAATLKLNSDEMQDPNEFARLLLDRMQELFSQSENLRRVLPSLFQGVMEYATVCKVCKNTSLRNENFMEFMVPLQAKTLEECIRVYGTKEELMGENQYYCDTCDCKQDATRSWKLQKLPPVLNIQVSRYAYNSQYGTKQKVMKELLLNDTLRLNAIEYQLVGVLNHVGTSANGGHYIAHAMDWSTGLWFECNDEQVTYLPSGSPAAYIDTPKKGSTDAYHLFYVEKNFLSEQVQDQIQNNFHLSNPVLQPILNQREDTFGNIQRLQTLHGKHVNQLNHQKNVLLSQVFPDLMTDVSVFVPKTSEDAVWVDRDWLRDVVNCRNFNVWENRDMTEHILCSHDKRGLHPRTARQGKLITKAMYEAINSIIPPPPSTIVVTPKENLYCPLCEVTHQQYLFIKNRKFITLLQLYSELETSTSTSNNEDPNLSYAVSRKFVTDLKKYTQQKMKQIVSSVDIQMNGIDVLNLKEIYDYDNVEDGVSSTSSLQSNTDSMDPEVNTKILCLHGKLNNQNAWQKIRYVSSSTWEKIIFLFPKAIAVKNTPCPRCLEDEGIAQDVSEGLKQWSMDQLDSDNLKAIFQKKEVIPTFSSVTKFILVPSKVVKDWRYCVEEWKKKKKNGVVNSSWREFIPNVLQSLFQLQQPKEELGILCSAHSKTEPFPPYVDLYIDRFIESSKMQDSLAWAPTTDKKIRNASPVEIMPSFLYECFVISLEMLRDIFIASYAKESDVSFPSGSFSMKDVLQSYIVEITFDEKAQYTVDPPMCYEKSCFRTELYKQSADEKEVVQDCIDVDQEDSTKSSTTNCEDEKEQGNKTCTFPVYEVYADCDLKTIATSEVSNHSDNNNSATQESPLRRSSRKRKSRDFFTESIRRFEILFDLEHDSLAKIRLILLERHQKSPLNQELTISLKTTTNEESEPILVSLPPKSNNSTVSNILSNHCIDSDITLPSPLSPSNIHCIYLRYTEDYEYDPDDFQSTQDKKPRKKKLNKQTREALESSLIDSLISCIGRDPGIRKSKGGSSMAETGFVGTLLQSSIQQPSSSNVVDVTV